MLQEGERLGFLIRRIGSYLGITVKGPDKSTDPLAIVKRVRTMIERGCPDEEIYLHLVRWRPTSKEKTLFRTKKRGKGRPADDVPLLALELFKHCKSWPKVVDELITLRRWDCPNSLNGPHSDDSQHIPKHTSYSNCCKTLEGRVGELRKFLLELQSSLRWK
jgi:hypothetical protein